MPRLFVAVCLLAVAAAAQERTTTVEQADHVLAAVDDAAKLKELADALQPAHWAVADELSSRGEHAAAIAYARASSRKDRDKLVAYLESRRAKPTPPGTWAKLEPLWHANFSAPKTVPERAAPLAKLPGYPGAFAQVTLAVALVRSGRPKEAEPLLREAFRRMQAIGCRDDSAWALYWISGIEVQTGRVEAAERGYRRMIALEPASLWRLMARESLAGLLEQRGAFAEAEKIYREILRDHPDNGSSWFGVARAAERRGEYDEALRLYRRARALLEPHNVPMVLDAIRRIHSRRGDAGKALALAREALAISRKLGQVQNIPTAECSLARMLLKTGEYKQASKLVQSALASYERLNSSSGVANALIVLGSIGRHRGDLVKARDAFQKALKLYRSMRSVQDIIATLTSLGGVEVAMGRSAEGIARLHEARSLARSLGAREQEARVLTSLGVAYAAAAEFEQAIACYEEVLVDTRKTGRRGLELRTQQLLGSVHSQRGDYDDALACFESALAGADRAARGYVLLSIGSIHEARGDLTAAREHIEQALVLVRALGQKRVLAQALNNLAVIDLALGSAPRARARYQEALRIARATGDRRSEALVLGNIGKAYFRAGEAAKALRYYGQARDLQEELGDRIGLVTTIHSLGGVNLRMGQLEQGEKLLGRAVALARELGLRHVEAKALGDLAHCARDPDRAEVAYREALAAYRAVGDVDAEAGALVNFAKVASMRGDHDGAIEHLEKARRIRGEGGSSFAATLELNLGAALSRAGRIDEALAASLRGLQHAQAAGVVHTEVALHGNLIGLYAGRNQHREAMASVRRALALMPMTVRGLASNDAALARDHWAPMLEKGMRAAAQLKDVREVSFVVESVRAGALLESLGGRDAVADIVIPEALRNAELRARAAVKKAEGALAAARRAKRRKRIRAARADLDAARSKLVEVIARIQREASYGAAVAYPKPDSLKTIQERLGEDEALVTLVPVATGALVFVTTRGQARAFEADGKLPDFVLHDPKRDYAAPLAKMQWLVESLRLRLDPKIRRVLISPAGRFAYLPFALILSDKEVAYVPSGTVLGLLRGRRPSKRDAILALGDPDYTGTSLSRLPATSAEAKAIGTRTLLGAEATKSALESALADGDWRAVHLACHGFVDPERPLLSELALTGSKLRVLDVFRTRMHADLVVLSACETGRGKAYRAEGVLGFTRAFLFAGTPRVIVSLWKVDDEATRALMVKFYELWKTQPAATALKDAQKFVASQEKWKHPYYWAAWQLWGLPE